MIQMPLRLPWILVWHEIQAWRLFGSVLLPQVVGYATYRSLEDQSLMGTPRYLMVVRMSMIWSTAVLAATNSDP